MSSDLPMLGAAPKNDVMIPTMFHVTFSTHRCCNIFRLITPPAEIDLKLPQ
jgi:hypothetical protein